MEKHKLQAYFLLTVLLITLVVSFFIFKPFLYTLILAGIFGIIFKPIYKRISKVTGKYKGLASLLTILIIFIFIFTPLVFLGMEIFKEASQLYYYFVDNGSGILSVDGNILSKIQDFLPKQFKSGMLFTDSNYSQFYHIDYYWHITTHFQNF